MVPSQVAVDYFRKRWRAPAQVVKQAQWMSVTVAGMPLPFTESPIIPLPTH